MLIELFPAIGDAPLLFGDGQPLTLTRVEGFSEAGVEPVTVAAPGQYGTTAVDLTVGSRVLSFTVACRADTHEAMLDYRRKLARAFFTPPSATSPKPALLRAHPLGLPVLELEALPRHGPVFDQRGPQGWTAEVELLAPYPYWREVDERFVRLEQVGGFTFPFGFPKAFSAYEAQQEIINTGNVPVGVLMRLYGDVTTPRLRNLTTGEVIEITGNVPAGSYVEINTRFGKKLVEMVDANGARTRIMSRLNLARADFWRVQPNANLIRYEADTVTAGAAAIFYWRPEISGL